MYDFVKPFVLRQRDVTLEIIQEILKNGAVFDVLPRLWLSYKRRFHC